MAVVTFVAAGAADSGTGAVTPGLPSGWAVGDIHVLIVQSSNQAITAPNGWTELSGSPQGTGTAGAAYAVRLGVFWRRAQSGDTAPTVADTGNHTIAQIAGFRGALRNGDPFRFSTGGVLASSYTAGSIGVTCSGGNQYPQSSDFSFGVIADSQDTSQDRWSSMSAPSPALFQSHTNSGTGGGFVCGGSYGYIVLSGDVTATATASGTNLAGLLFAIKAEFPATIVPNTADAYNFGTDTTPTLEFTGTDPEGVSDITYEAQIATDRYFWPDTTSPLMFIPESGYTNGSQTLYGTYDGAGETFSGSFGGTLTTAKFYIIKTGSPSASIYARVYDSSWNLLAESDAVAPASVPAGPSLITFNFTGANQLTLQENGDYRILACSSGGTTTDHYKVCLYKDVVTNDYPNNSGCFHYAAGGGLINGSYEFIFYVYISHGVTLTLDKLSASDAGFANTENGSDTDPFTSGQKISFTVQAGDALTAGTWYWRARAKDTSGSTLWSDWTTGRSFTISSGAVLPVGTGAFALGGVAVGLRADRKIAPAAGAFAFGAQNVGLAKGKAMSVGQAGFAFGAQPVALARGRRLDLSTAGGFAFDGKTVGLVRGRLVAIAQAGFAYAGVAAAFLRGKSIAPAPANFAFGAQPVALRAARTMPVGTANFGFAGVALGFARGRVLAVGAAAFEYAGVALGFARGRGVALATGAFEYAGQTVALARSRVFALSAGAFEYAGQLVGTLRGLKTAIATAAFGYGAEPVALLRGHPMPVESGGFAFSGVALGFVKAWRVLIGFAGFGFAGQDVSLRKSGVNVVRTQNVSANAATVAISSTQANDVILVFAYNASSTTIPTLVGGYTSLGTQAPGGSANACRLAYKVSAGGETSIGTWTSATRVVAFVYRGLNTTTPFLHATGGAGNSTALLYGAVTNDYASDWVAGFGGAKSATAGMDGSTTNLTNRTAQTTVNGLDTGAATGGIAQQTLNVTTSGRWLTYTLEVCAATEKKVTIEAGAFPFAGVALPLARSRLFPIGVGGFAFSGVPVVIRPGKTLAVTAGAFGYGGQPLGFPRGFRLAIAPDGFAFDGRAVTLARGRAFAISPASIAFDGRATALQHGAHLDVNAAAFAFDGVVVGLRFNRSLPVAPGAFVFDGRAVAFPRGRDAPLGTGSFSFDGKDVTLTLQTARRLNVGTGAFGFDGRALAFVRTRRFAIAPGAFGFDGVPVGFLRGRGVSLGAGSFAYNGRETAFHVARRLEVSGASFGYAGADVAPRLGRLVAVSPGAFALGGSPLALRAYRILRVESGAFEFVGYDVDIYQAEAVYKLIFSALAEKMTLTIAELPASITVGIEER